MVDLLLGGLQINARDQAYPRRAPFDERLSQVNGTSALLDEAERRGLA
ncbi:MULTISPECIES: hypothetical protein [Brucella]|uniref:Uncharacterized protein n=2 Tax=Brucella TaxID=234 RepID=A0A256GLY6_9HYPH|nr:MULTISPECIES: hypothetical protein [Brucella]MCR8491996.1 hypothetical protein [Brucella anthropi]NKW09757.1 hypothetical protein [Brucella tritici]OYR28122.1 hypothetical protein CES86_3122 [Brucella lupini]